MLGGAVPDGETSSSLSFGASLSPVSGSPLNGLYLGAFPSVVFVGLAGPLVSLVSGSISSVVGCSEKRKSFVA